MQKEIFKNLTYVIAKTFGPPRNQTNYIFSKGDDESFPKLLYLLKLSNLIKSYGHLNEILAYFC